MKKILIMIILVLAMLAITGCQNAHVASQITPTPKPHVSYEAETFLSIDDFVGEIKNKSADLRNTDDDFYSIGAIEFFYQLISPKNVALTSIEVKQAYVSLKYDSATSNKEEYKQIFLVMHRDESGAEYIVNYARSVNAEEKDGYYKREVNDASGNLVGQNYYFLLEEYMVHLYLPLEYFEERNSIAIEKVIID